MSTGAHEACAPPPPRDPRTAPFRVVVTLARSFASDVLRSFGSLPAPAPPPVAPTEEEMSEPAAHRKRTAKR